MPKANTTVKAVRVDNDKLEALEKLLCGRTINSWLNEKIEEAVGLPSDVNKKTALHTGLPDDYKEKYEKLLDEVVELRNRSEAEIPTDALKDIEAMAGLFGMSMEQAIKDFDDLMNDGSISVSGGHLVCTLPDWVMKVEEICHDRCIPLVSMGKKIADMMERGQI